MKVIFLDIDGVLNSYQSTIMYMDSNLTEPEKVLALCPICISNLNYTIKKTKAKIVIHSSWRLYNNIEDIKNYLKKYGFKYLDSIIDMTSKKLEKKEGIEEYLKNHQKEIEKYVVIDDYDLGLKKEDKGYQSKIDQRTGYSVVEAFDVIEWLDGDQDHPSILM